MGQCVKNIVERDRPQMTIWRMRIACWIPKDTNTHCEYVILIAFPLQQLLHQRALILRAVYTAHQISAEKANVSEPRLSTHLPKLFCS